jgi:hypothetical protein
MALRIVVSILLSLAFVATPDATEPRGPADAFLSAAFDVAKSDLSRIAGGRVYARTLAVHNEREVATLGIVRIKTTPQRYVKQLADIAAFKNDEAILQIGTFSTPPQPDDLARLTLDEADLRSLRDCRPGDCDVQLSSDAIDRLRTVSWQAPDASRRATDLLRRLLAEYVTRYLQIGATAVMEYADSSGRLALADEFSALLAADTTTWAHVPALRGHLVGFPSARAYGATDLVYWSKERVHRRAVVSVTHLAIVPGEHSSPVAYAIASKQIYAMHYFDASLGITLLVPDAAASPPSTYVVYLNRSRIDLFDGLWGGMARQVVKGKARSLVAEQLGRIRTSLEKAG